MNHSLLQKDRSIDILNIYVHTKFNLDINKLKVINVFKLKPASFDILVIKRFECLSMPSRGK